ncbi:SWI/SNF-related matrix-associated actin-dependent regulator of chromatin subfamily E member 1-related-like isoform X2 [Leptonychotes weddellii]|uniref:SWI/SNF-related matrix-associated actin-dependent regulator of chromatin subfamily E member 1-related-like isoform X2 n=1 Tax=Leptonychotes weddellii TaxID=9713 RepID=A0A7F8Q4X0_LEPWE|nr:SWI/SNF-related matrix-associated actin-dependent regulator of chromatin subfamily E member 1-related-like isoform X2 [Leptonychotes weddellii]
MQHVVLANRGDPKEQDTEEPKKRKGGWPKGRKRKPPRDISVPCAPMTGYRIFLNEQRSQLRARHPDLPFTEITKMLAAQWAQLSQEKKQRYVYEADKDKQRYIRELWAYQSSQACRAFLQRQAAHEARTLLGAWGHFLASGSTSDPQGDHSSFRCFLMPPVFQQDQAHQETDWTGRAFRSQHLMGMKATTWYCRACKQFFSSLHNKKEHLLGKQHLQNLTDGT